MSAFVLQTEEKVSFKLDSDTQLIRDELELTANYNVVASTDVNLIFADIEVGNYLISDPNQQNGETGDSHLNSYTSQSADSEWHDALQVVKGWGGSLDSANPGWSNNTANFTVGQTGTSSATLQDQLMFILRKLLYPFGAPTTNEGTGTASALGGNLLDLGKVQAWIDESTNSEEVTVPNSAPFGRQLFTVSHMQSFIDDMITNGRIFFNQVDNVARIDCEHGDLLRIHVTLADYDLARNVTLNFNLRHHFTAPAWRSSSQVAIPSADWSHQLLAKGLLTNANQNANNGVTFAFVTDNPLTSGQANSYANFALDSSTGVVTMVSPGDLADGIYYVQVTATANDSDGNAQSSDQVITFYKSDIAIRMVDPNDASSTVLLTSTINIPTADQNAFTETLSGPDSSKTYSWDIRMGGEYAEMAGNNGDRLQVINDGSTNQYVKDQYLSLSIRMTDSDGNFCDQDVKLRFV